MDFAKLRLIIGREYLSLAGRKSFIVMTLLIPVLVLLCSMLPILFMYINEQASGETKTIAIIDETCQYAQAVKPLDGYRFVPLTGQKGSDARAFYNHAKESVEAVVVIPADVLQKPTVTIFSESVANITLREHLNDCLRDTLTKAKVASYGVPDLQRMIDESQVNVNVETIKWTADGEENQAFGEFASGIGLMLSITIYMFVIMYGAMIMNSVIEEKTNRIVEVMVSSCKPFELMMGKIVGVGLVGLTQFAIWVILFGAIGSFASMSLSAMATHETTAAAQYADFDPSTMKEIFNAIMSIDYGRIIIAFLLYFIGGYMLYASLFAAFGSAVDQASDASQFQTPIIIVMMIALYAGIASATNPDGQMAVWCSMIPFTSPVVMMVRLPYDVPLWQIALSLVMLFVTAALLVWVSARIYRTGILLYGKKYSWTEVMRWIKE